MESTGLNRNRHSISLSLVITLLCGFLHGARAETLTPIHIGVPTNSATWFPLYVAWKRGIFRDQGLDLLPITMQARTALAALASKQIGFITQIGSPMTAIARGLPASPCLWGLGGWCRKTRAKSRGEPRLGNLHRGTYIGVNPKNLLDYPI